MLRPTATNESIVASSSRHGTVSEPSKSTTISNSSMDDVGSSNSSGSSDIVQVASAPSPLTTDAKIARGGRIGVMIVLLFSAIAVSALTYILLSQNEDSAFRAEFESSARQVILMANRNAVNVFIGMKTMANVVPTTAAATAEALNMTPGTTNLPFLALKGFPILGAGFRNVTKASFMGFLPYLKTRQDMEKWNKFSPTAGHNWITRGHQYEGRNNESSEFPPFIYVQDNTSGTPVPVPDTSDGPYVPAWQGSPVPPKASIVNYNLYTNPDFKISFDYVIATKLPILSKPVDARMALKYDMDGPVSTLTYPIFEDALPTETSELVAFLRAVFAWKNFFTNTLPPGSNNVEVVVDSCKELSTYKIDGPTANFVGYGDLHNPRYNAMQVSNEFIKDMEAIITGIPRTTNATTTTSNTTSTAPHKVQKCQHTLHVYPTAALEHTYKTNLPRNYAMIVFCIFVFAALVFLAYDWFVTNRQHRTERSADQSNAIVQELFPGDTAQRLFASSPTTTDVTSNKKSTTLAMSGFGKVDRTTIAELHPEATVMFADISGFTAWSSIRDPHQVFTLLESIFQAFDSIAKKCGAFKVETVGDCYVAACGVPTSNQHHAIVMCRFARHAMAKFRWVCRRLELMLGPDTSDLSLRIGMHSGPITAGVLRGDRARFQLFGDTVNTASRIESTGKRERVHLSEQTANELIKHGKGDWIVRREDTVEAKGKGKLVTYWLKLTNNAKDTASVAGSSELGDEDRGADVVKEKDASEWNIEMPAPKSGEQDNRIDRLVQWNSDLLIELLQRVVSRRLATKNTSSGGGPNLTTKARSIGNGQMVVDEVAEIIDMPKFVCAGNNDEVELSEVVVSQLRAYVAQIASMYNSNPFHNFEHASHVTMSINKLLTRIVAPKLDANACSDADQQEALLHDHTCGITSDPLTQFAVVLSGLLHDLDHPGVSNGQLAKENPVLATRYQEKSLAEQNSVDLAWKVLMSPHYKELRDAIYATETELQRFRCLLVNSIIATDIFDKDQSALRKNRWNKAFYETAPDDTSHEARCRKATIVIEHLIQASDVAHTMQHWHVYQKWNQRLFNEMMTAYRAGRADKDPSLGWYGGELWFFDNYVIPLTKKLKDCGVFGVSSDEYLNYALQNRDEWESKGKDVVQQYLKEFESFSYTHADSPKPSSSLFTI